MTNEKFGQIVLALCNAIPQEHLATVKLNKLIWLIDKTSMCRRGHTITGLNYIRKDFGPVPENNRDLLHEMKNEGLIEVAEEFIDSGELKSTTRCNYKGLIPPDFHGFTTEDISIINEIISNYGKYSTKQLVNISHDLVWATFNDNEQIPMEAYLIKSTINDNSGVIKRKIQKAEDRIVYAI